MEMVDQAKKLIREGDMFQCVLSQRLLSRLRGRSLGLLPKFARDQPIQLSLFL